MADYSKISATIQKNWKDREYIEGITLMILRITEFLNRFDLSTQYRAAKLNEDMTHLERKIEFLEAALLTAVNPEELAEKQRKQMEAQLELLKKLEEEKQNLEDKKARERERIAPKVNLDLESGSAPPPLLPTEGDVPPPPPADSEIMSSIDGNPPPPPPPGGLDVDIPPPPPGGADMSIPPPPPGEPALPPPPPGEDMEIPPPPGGSMEMPPPPPMDDALPPPPPPM